MRERGEEEQSEERLCDKDIGTERERELEREGRRGRKKRARERGNRERE